MTVDETALRPSERRLLALLATPMPIADIARRLGVTRQRVHQLVDRMARRGAVRLSTTSGPGRVVARTDDPVSLLHPGQARTLSALTVRGKSTLRSVAAAAGLGHAEAATVLGEPAALDLAAEATHRGEPGFWSLTEAGEAHPQVCAPARKATRARSGFLSDRREAVLALLLDQGPLRDIAISRRLGIERQTGNALMQYFKRKGWIAKSGEELFSAYALAALGAEALEMLDLRRYEDQRTDT